MRQHTTEQLPVENLPALPKGWKWVKLGEVAKIVTGTTPSKSNQKFYSNDFPFYKPTDLDAGKNVEESKDGLSELGLKNARFAPVESVLVTCIGATIGKTGFLKKGGAFNQQINAVLPSPKNFNPKFIFYQITSPPFQKQIKDNASSTTLPIINKGKFEDIIISLPPLSIQTQIVEKLEQLLSALDAGKAQLLSAQAQLKTYRQAVLKYAFEGKFSGGMEGWEALKTGDVIKKINNGYTPKSNFLTQNIGEIPFIKVYNLTFNGKLDFKNPTFIPQDIHLKDLKRSICYPNDVLINIVGPPLGKVSVVPTTYPEWNINQAIVLFRPNQKVLPGFLAYFLQNPVIINWLENTSKATAGQWNVKVSTCREIPINLPPLPIQTQIVAEIESRLSVCDKMEESIATALRQSETLRQSLLKRAFEGKLL